VVDVGVDGWWPDQGDGLDAASQLARIRMYWEGSQIWRPNERPFALHRNGYAGMQRYGAFVWSGDVYTTWETLRTHLPLRQRSSSIRAQSGSSQWYDDDGVSFEHKRGAFMRAEMRWQDTARTLHLSLAPRSRMLGPPSRPVEVRVAGSTRTRSVRFDGSARVRF
jgi:Glycosyl hydrolases family 31/Domain of unknown function (DUF5110)